MNNLALNIEVNVDPAKSAAGLAEVRRGLLTTYQDAKAEVGKFGEQLAAAQERAQSMARAMGEAGPPTKAMVKEFEAARAAVNAADAALQRQVATMQAARAAARANADSLADAREAAAALAAAQTKAAAETTFRRQLAEAQALLDAENQLQREIRETAVARQEQERFALNAAAQQRQRVAEQMTLARQMATQSNMSLLGTRTTAAISAEIMAVQRALASLKTNGAGALDIQRAAEAARQKLAALNTELRASQSAADAGGQSYSGFAQRLAAVVSAAVAAREAINFLRESVKSGLDNQSLKTQFTFGMGGDVKKSAEEMAYASSLANRLGLELLTTEKAYGKLLASARGTTLEGKATRDIFTAIASASSVMGLSAEDQAGALLAISQMMSKGTVSAEELRGQLGERLPGAFKIAAQAMRVTEAELAKMMENGEIAASSFLPKFAAALQQSINGQLPAAEASARAGLQRLENAFTEFKIRIANSGLLDKVADQVDRLLAHIANLADSGELDRIATSFANAFGAGIKFMADAAIMAERFSGVLVPLAEALLALTVGGRALALVGAGATGVAAAGSAATAAATGFGLLAGALRLLKSLTVGGLIIAGVAELIEWAAKSREAKSHAEALENQLQDLIQKNNEFAGTTRLDADAIGEFGDEAMSAYEKAIKGARDYAAAKVVDLVKNNKNGQFDSQIEQYRNDVIAYNIYIDTVLRGEQLRRQEAKLTGQLLEKEAEREKILAGQVKQTRAEALAAQIKDYEKLTAAIAKAREEAQKEAEDAKKSAQQKRDGGAEKAQSAADKATQMRNKDLPPEIRQAEANRVSEEAYQQALFAEARAELARMEGRAKDFERYQGQAEKLADRAQRLAEEAGNPDRVEEAGKLQQRLAENSAKADDKKAAEAEQRAGQLMDQLNQAQSKLEEMKGEAATIKVNGDIVDLVSKIAEVKKELDSIQDKTVTINMVTKNSIDGSAPTDGLPTRAFGGPLPGSAPHDRADNMLYWGTPGEWVIQRPAVRYYGENFIARLNSMRLPRYATGGAIGAQSAASRLMIPRLSSDAGRQEGALPGMSGLVLDLGALGKHTVYAPAATQQSLTRQFKLAALQFGKKP